MPRGYAIFWHWIAGHRRLGGILAAGGVSDCRIPDRVESLVLVDHLNWHINLRSDNSSLSRIWQTSGCSSSEQTTDVNLLTTYSSYSLTGVHDECRNLLTACTCKWTTFDVPFTAKATIHSLLHSVTLWSPSTTETRWWLTKMTIISRLSWCSILISISSSSSTAAACCRQDGDINQRRPHCHCVTAHRAPARTVETAENEIC